mgnify:CR=1 FL=1
MLAYRSVGFGFIPLTTCRTLVAQQWQEIFSPIHSYNTPKSHPWHHI